MKCGPDCDFSGTQREVDDHVLAARHWDERPVRQSDPLPKQATGEERANMEWAGRQLGDRRDV